MSDRPNDSVALEGALCAQWRVFGLRARAAADRLAERIPALCDATGALPTQEILAQVLGVSRALLREAVSRLVARGVVDVRTKVGSRVVDERQWQLVDRHVVGWRLARATDPDFLANITEIRRVLEPLAAADAAQHASPEQRARITFASAMRLSATSLADYAIARRQLHVALLAASPNQFLQQLTCLVPPLDSGLDPTAPAPAISEAERRALVQLEAAIRDADAVVAREGIERLNKWDLPNAGGQVDA
ncbi:FadR family transcriptional regulator [Trinickia dabaoshanensis]|uniref:FadR family transcriptional regulator n=1 Tax=Trinickia dabaoshanensis TaxID=564714 RepID=A0A2N7VEQ7_9BURK|nr:GntR family transcriptional regulator [Trinickia dabaoshanensis]PMS15604.1 FadR family transcriptional regulator [Trinickia dabaoshanensis]